MSDSFVTFKGVMLCSRPPQVQPPPPYISPSMQKMLERPAFVGAVVPPVPLGTNPPKREQRVVGQPKKKPVTVTGKHKQWLAKFQEGKLQEARSEEERQRQQEKSRKVLAEKSAQMRRNLKALQAMNLTEEEMKERLSATWEAPISERAENEQDDESSYSIDTTSSVVAREELASLVAAASSVPTAAAPALADAPVQRRWIRRRRADKPAWALTEEESEVAQEEEVDDLISFANNLNFDKFVSTLEVRESLRYMEEKLERIEAAKSAAARKAAAESRGEIGPDDDEYEWVEVDEDGLTEVEAVILKRQPHLRKQLTSGNALAQERGWNSSTRVDDNKSAAALAAVTAREIAALKSGRSDVANIHSDASLRTLVSNARTHPSTETQLETTSGSSSAIPASLANTVASATKLSAITPPKVVVVSANATGKPGESDAPGVSSTFRPANLPYLYRNPSI